MDLYNEAEENDVENSSNGTQYQLDENNFKQDEFKKVFTENNDIKHSDAISDNCKNLTEGKSEDINLDEYSTNLPNETSLPQTESRTDIPISTNQENSESPNISLDVIVHPEQ